MAQYSRCESIVLIYWLDLRRICGYTTLIGGGQGTDANCSLRVNSGEDKTPPVQLLRDMDPVTKIMVL